MKKSISNLTVSTLRVEEMFNVRGGDDEGSTKTNTSSTANSTAKGEDEDIIL